MKIYRLIIPILLIICRLNSTCQNASWVKQIAGTGNIIPFKSIVDKSNNIYIIGYFTGQLHQGSITLNSFGGNDGFVAKFDNSGSLLWIKQIGGIGTENPLGISLSFDGNSIFIGGTFQYTCKFSPSDSITVSGIQDATNFDAFLAKYSLDGNLQSVRKIAWGLNNTDDLQNIRAFGIDKYGKLLIGGIFKNKIYFANDSLTGIAGYQNYIAKINEDGTVINKKLISGTDITANTLVYSMDVCNNGYYWAGYYSKNLTFDLGTISSNGGTIDMFIYKTDFNLNGQWIRKISGAGSEYCTSVTCDSLNNVYVGGYFNTPNPGITIDSTATLTCAQHPITHGGYDIFYAKYQPNGKLDWYHTAGSAGASPNNDDDIFRALYGSGVFVVAGKFGGNFTYRNHNLTYSGGTGTDVLGIVHDSKDNLIYALGFGGTGNDIGETAAIDNLGNYYFIGDFASASLTLGGTTLTNGGGKDLFITKYPKGNLDKIITNVKCKGTSTGSIIVTPHGPLSVPYTYSWTKAGDGSYSSNKDSLSNLSAGTYRVHFTDGMGFSLSDSVIITEPVTQISITLDSAMNANCRHDTTGKMYITPYGGTSPYSYLWITQNGAHLEIANEEQPHVTAGNYSVFVTDNNGCLDSLKNITITQPATNVAITSAVISPIHFGLSDGAVNIIATGGTQYSPAPAYHYAWTGPMGFTATTQNISSLSNSGDYAVKVTDKQGCRIDTTVLVQDTLHLFVRVISQINVSCHGGSNGSATVQAVNAKGGTRITWTPGNMHTATINGLTAQLYTVTISDSGRVAPDSIATATINITQPAASLNAGFIITNLKCFEIHNGSIDLTVTGGTLPFLYQWTKDGIPFATTEDLVNLSSGNYAYSVTDAKGCSVSGITPVTSPAQLSIVSASTFNQTCFQGRNDGSVNLLTVSGGNPYSGNKYFYNWSNGISGLDVKSITLLSPNNYGVIIKDSLNCAINGQFTVNAGPTIGGSITRQDVSCHDASDGQATMNPSFQAGRYLGSYLWTDPAQDTTQTAPNLSAGSVTVVVSDNLGCEGYFNTTIRNKQLLSLTEDVSSHINVTCHGGNNGQLGVIATGGSGLYEYQLNGDGWFNSNIYSTLTAGKYKVVLRDRNAPSCKYSGLDSITITEPAQFVVNLSVNPGIINCAGTPVTFTATTGLVNYDFNVGGITVQSGASNTYITSTLVSGNIVTVTGTNASGCSNISMGITMTVNPNPEIIASVIHQVSCNGAGDGMARVVASGGTAPYNLSWNTSPVQTNDTAINLSPGMYKVSVTDFKGCGPVADSVIITQMPPLNLTEVLANHKNVKCNGDHSGSFKVAATGGSGNYEYAVNSLSNWVTTSQFSNDSAGMYKVLVRDSNATTCIYNGLDSIAITKPLPITAVILSHDISCFGKNDGMAVVYASGGTGILQLLWNDPSTSTNDTISNLSQAIYQVSITDDSSCNKIFSSTINEPALFSLSVSNTKNTKCSNDSTGAINISATGGRLPYSFTWSNGATTQNLDLIPAGNYSMDATDSSGCTANLSTSVSGAAPINATIIADTITCYGNSTGRAIAITSGGTGKLHPVWNDPLNTQSDTIANVPAGNYILTLVDDSSCTKMFTTEITQLDSLYLTENIADHMDAKCNGTASGSFGVLASGGSGKYEFTSDSTTWTTDSIFTDLKAGSYRFILRDQKNHACYYNKMPSIIIDQPLPLTVSKPVVTTTSTWTSKDGTISVIASGGPGQINYTLYPGEITNHSGTFTVGLGNYMITVSDELGCDTILSGIAYVGPFPDAVGQYPILYKLDIYPNPSSGLFNITYVNPAVSKMVTEVYNTLGVKIFIKEFTNKSGDSFNEKIDLEAKPKGIYFIRINGVTFKDKLVIQ